MPLAACGGSDKNSQSAAETATAAKLPAADRSTVTVESLERNGKLILLDRTTDITGMDLDKNGVRDDIDRWVQSQPFSTDQKKAATQLAVAIQSSLVVDISNDIALRAVQTASREAVTCIFARFPTDAQPNPSKVIHSLQKYTVNTRERVMVYLAYNHALNGSVNKIPPGDNCA